MLKPENDPFFSNTFRDFEPEHGDRWSQIEAALPKEKKRRVLLLLWLGLGLLAGGSLLLLLPDRETAVSETVSIPETAPANPKQMASPDTAEAKAEDNSVVMPAENNGIRLHPDFDKYMEMPDNWQRTEGLSITDPYHESGTNVPPATSSLAIIEPEVNTEIPSSVSGEAVPADTVSAPEESAVPPILAKEVEEEVKVKTNDGNQEKNENTNKKSPAPSLGGKWSMGIGFGVYASRFTPKMPESVGNYSSVNEPMVRENYRLRQQIEKQGYSFSQSLWIHYKPFERWSFSSGISMVQSTQVLKFSIQSNTPDNISSPGDFPERGNSGPGGVYLFPNDSILPGNNTVTHNRYLAREVPFFISYHQPVKDRWSLTINAGITYRWVRSLSVYLPDIDNIGMVYMQGPEYYPGVKSTFHLQGGIGVNYRLNDYFSLQAMPTFQLATRSNIRFEHYIQQHQKQWGCQFVLTRKLGF